MAAIITNKFRVLNAETLLKSTEGASPLNRLYLFIGRHLSWTDDTIPDQPIDSDYLLNEVWTNMLSMKAISRSDLSLGIQKRKWSYGFYYDIYRHDYGQTGVTGLSETGQTTSPQSLADANYYTVTDNGNVYICIDNNKGAPSYENPENFGTGIGYQIFTTPDKYRWKYICSVSGPDYAAFSTLEFHPVKTIDTQPPINDDYEDQYFSQEAAALTGGAVYNVLVVAAGTGGTPGATITIPTANIKGDGQDMECEAVLNSNGGVDRVVVTAPGSGYTYCEITAVPGLTSVTLKPIITPRTGLGANPVYDLNAFYVLANVRLQYNEGDGDFTVNNNFRQIGIIANPLRFNGAALTDGTADCSYTLKLGSGESYNFAIDSEIINLNGTKNTRAKIVDWDAAADKKKLRVLMVKPNNIADYVYPAGFSTGETIQVVGTNHTSVIDTVTTTPTEVRHYSGQILYYENRKPIQRDITQIEDLHLAFEF